MAKQQKTTQKTDVPEWLDAYGETAFGKAKEVAADFPTEFKAYEAPRVADFSGDQTNAFQQLRNLIAGAPQIGPEAMGMVRTAANAPAQAVSTERVVDEGGKLGTIASYTDPYMKAAEGPVQAAIRKITEAADATRKKVGAGATMAGAFGDARHGVAEAENEKNRGLAIGETAGNLYSKAMSDAMAARTGDLNRFGATDTANAQFNETALGRLFKGATDLTGTAQADQQRLLQQVSALLESGGKQQANEQLGLDRAFEEFIREYGHDFNVLNALTGAAKGTPTDSTTTSKAPDNSWMGALGSIAGALLAPVTAGGSTVLGSMLTASDARVKDDITPVGTLDDGKTVYRFRYKGDPSGRTHIGLMAQEVEQSKPEAVVEIFGVKLVDYRKATERPILIDRFSVATHAATAPAAAAA
jgi:hypothetical protein